jgi:hypothetical protein
MIRSRQTANGIHARSTRLREKWATLLLSWLIPGYGFFRYGYRRRAIFLFVCIELTFLLGTALRGSVLVPEFRWDREGFNIVALLTFVTQIFNGGLGLLSMLPDVLGPRFAILPYDEAYCWADLGGFFLLVSGGLNYFVLTSIHDHFYATRPGKSLPPTEEVRA